MMGTLINKRIKSSLKSMTYTAPKTEKLSRSTSPRATQSCGPAETKLKFVSSWAFSTSTCSCWKSGASLDALKPRTCFRPNSFFTLSFSWTSIDTETTTTSFGQTSSGSRSTDGRFRQKNTMPHFLILFRIQFGRASGTIKPSTALVMAETHGLLSNIIGYLVYTFF